MTFALDPRRPLDAELVRVVQDEVTGARASVDEILLTGHEEAVHDVRKRAKKLRAVARLVRDELDPDAYHRANVSLRDAARSLSASRDAQVLVETLDGLLGWTGRDRRAWRSVWTELERRSRTAAHEVRGHEGVAVAVGETFERLGREATAWPLSGDVDALLPGVERVYRRGRRAYRRALDEPGTEDLHEWRKRAKYLWYHVRLLAPAAPDVLGGLRDLVDELAGLLGDDHDLAVLVDTMAADPDAFGGVDAVGAVREVAGARRAELVGRARELGRQLYVERPRRFTARLGATWRSAG